MTLKREVFSPRRARPTFSFFEGTRGRVACGDYAGERDRGGHELCGMLTNAAELLRPLASGSQGSIPSTPRGREDSSRVSLTPDA